MGSGRMSEMPAFTRLPSEEEASVRQWIDDHRTDATWQKPEIIDYSDLGRLKKLIELGKIATVSDNRDYFLDEFAELADPKLYADEERRTELLTHPDILERANGVWVIFPWTREAVHYPQEADYYDLRTSRFRNLITRDEQDKLHEPRIAIAGLSVGSNLVGSLVQAGIGGSLVMSDMKNPKVSNIGRAGYDIRDIGVPKIDAIARKISHIDPFLEQIHIPEGITAETVSQLEAARPDMIIDEVDDMVASALLRKLARKLKVPYISAADVGDRAVLEVCRHDLSDKAPLYAGHVGDKVADRLVSGRMTEIEKMLVFARSIGFRRLSPELIESAVQVGETLSGLPQLGRTAMMSAALATGAIHHIILGNDVGTGIYTMKSPVSKRASISGALLAVTTVVKYARS